MFISPQTAQRSQVFYGGEFLIIYKVSNIISDHVKNTEINLLLNDKNSS